MKVIKSINLGIHVNGIEFPVVSVGEARLRVNLMPQHTKEHMDLFIEKFESALKQSNEIFEKTIKKME
jgi:glycine C-acetyltransferase